MYYVMEACAENKKEMIILDRPNPCDYVEGPVLKAGYKSFVGILPLPVLHGCTIGELAQMINGEGWMTTQAKDLSADCDTRKRVETRTALCTSRETVSQLAQCAVHPPLCLTLPF